MIPSKLRSVAWQRSFIATLVLASFESVSAQVVINEVLARNHFTNTDEDGDSSDWVELYNPGPESVDLTDHALSDSRADLRKWVLPRMVVPADSYVLLWCSGKNRVEAGEDRIVEPNSPLPFVANLIDRDDEWRYTVGMPEDEGPTSDWRSPDYDDTSWETGLPAFGFGNDDGIRSETASGIGGLLLRRTFEFRPGLDNLVLQLRFDDGFVAYLNGERVAAGNFPDGEEPTFASTATRSHSPRRSERFDLTPFLESLTPGPNTLAIFGLNTRTSSSDVVLDPELGTVPPVLHTSFRLTSAGESLFLVDPGGEIVDEVSFPPQSFDQSYARSPNGSGGFRYHLTPSPLVANGGPTGDRPLVVTDTVFSVDRGFYEEPFDVEITSATEGAEIRFTLDGSEPSEENGTLLEGAVSIDGTTTLRARAFKVGMRPTNIDSQTYVFLDDVVRQDLQATLAYGFPRTWGATAADYGMDPDVIGPRDRFGGIYVETIVDDLRSLPTMSIVMDIADLLGPRGIYTNSESRGPAWERPASVEMFSPEDGTEFQVNCGIRIQGGWFRSHSGARKHSLRLLFKRRYGPTKLESSLFGEDGNDRFDTITLRAGANDGYSWNAARLTEQYTRDEFGRSLQRATGNAGARGTFVHLYINGIYWGVYNPVERPDHSFSAKYYGGDKDDWDAVHDLQTTNGDNRAWGDMLRVAARARSSLEAYQELQGRNPDGSANPDFPHLADVPNYVDYLIVNVYGGNWDWPWKNWWAGRDRTASSTGFKFYCWDYENTMGNNRDRSPLHKNALQNNFSSAGELHTNLRSNSEYRQLFADRIHRLFFNDGPLTPASLVPRYDSLVARVERAIVAESARWGDQHHGIPLTQREWRTERDWLLRTYLVERSGIVLQQFRAAGLYPRIAAPEYARHGGVVPAGYRALLHVPQGEVLYTTNGADPRLPGGEVSPFASVATLGDPVTVLPAAGAVRIHVPSDDSLGRDWTAADFDDSGWDLGTMPVGYETGSGYEELIATDLREAMHEVNATVYLRQEFVVEDLSTLAFLTLRMRYDDGFVGYLNGERVVERNARADTEWNSRASRSHSDNAAVDFASFDLRHAAEHLVSGRNVFALQAMNFRATDGDFLMQSEIVATDSAEGGIAIDASTRVLARARVEDGWSALDEAVFLVDTGIPLRVTEIMYHPALPPAGGTWESDDFEFVELLNVGASSIRLEDIVLRGAVEFEFARSPETLLEPGQRIVVVENLEAFASLHDVSGIRVAGQYRGKLDNDGERLILEGFLGEPILDFTYSDEWHPVTDGGGRSLVFADPAQPREAWSDGAGWISGAVDGGSPGADDGDVEPRGGWQRIGDIDQNGRLNTTDAVLILTSLVLGREPRIPCDPGAARGFAAGGNLTVYDVDASGDVNLTDGISVLNFLFRRGAPPALGTDCVRVDGCPDACSD